MAIKKSVLLSLFLIQSIFAQSYDYDVVIIGAGASGITAAEAVYNAGKKVLLVEKKRLGGGRIWSGDIPFKILFKHSYNVYHCNFLNQEHSKAVVADAKKNVMDFVRESRNAVYQVLYQNIVNKCHIPVEFGQGYFIDDHTFFIQDKYITAQSFFVATGAKVYIPPLQGLSSIKYYTRENFFDLACLPDSITILGGGPLGTELASSLNRLGVKVTLIMSHNKLLADFDEELVDVLTEILKKEGVNVVCGLRATQVEKKDDSTIVLTGSDNKGNIQQFESDHLFIATGSTPNVKNLGLETIGVDYTKRGIRTNEQLQTTVSNIYAIGDVVGSLVLTRVAYYHAKLLVELLFGKKKSDIKDFTYKTISKVIFTYPSLAMSGLTENQAYMRYGNDIIIYKFPYTQLEKAYVDGNTQGFVKFICDKYGILIGVHVLGEGAGDIVDFATLGVSLYDLCSTESKKVRTSPSYFDIFQKMIDEHLIEKQSEKKEQHSIWSLLGW